MKLNKLLTLLIMITLTLNLVPGHRLKVLQKNRIWNALMKRYQTPAKPRIWEMLFDPAVIVPLVYGLEMIYWTTNLGFMLRPILALLQATKRMGREERALFFRRLLNQDKMLAIMSHFDQDLDNLYKHFATITWIAILDLDLSDLEARKSIC